MEKAKKFAYKAYKFSNSWPGTIIIVLLVIFFVAQAFRIPSGSMKSSLLIGDHLFAKKFAYGISTPHLPFLEIALVPGTDGHIIDGDTPERGDIVIFRPPHNKKMHYVKRCVALPGDEIFMVNKELYLHPFEGDDYTKEFYKGYELINKDGKLWVKNPYRKEHIGIHNDKSVTQDSPVVLYEGGRYEPVDRRSEVYKQLRSGLFRVENGTFYEHNPLFAFPVKRIAENEYFMMGDNRDHSNDSRFWGTVPYGLIEGTPWFVYFSINDNYEIRWDRMGKTPSDLEQKEYIDRAIAEDIIKDQGIF